MLIFGALLEFAIVNYVGTTEERAIATMIQRQVKLHVRQRMKDIEEKSGNFGQPDNIDEV